MSLNKYFCTSALMISRVSVVICLLCIAALRQRLASSWQEDVRRYVQSKEWDAVMAIVDSKSPAVRWRLLRVFVCPGEEGRVRGPSVLAFVPRPEDRLELERSALCKFTNCGGRRGNYRGITLAWPFGEHLDCGATGSA